MEYIFTFHAKIRVKSRNLTENEIIEIINHPKKILKRQGKHYAFGNNWKCDMVVVYERTERNIKIITVFLL